MSEEILKSSARPIDATDENAEQPIAVLLGGPNGAGKSTAAPSLLKGALHVTEFLNADLIARGLSPFDPDGAALAAGKVMLSRMDVLASQRISFGLESTLAARTLAPRIRDLIVAGYEFHLVFLYLPSADQAIARVADRVRHGGHDIPEETIRRRYAAGLRNFFTLYRPLAATWKMFDNSQSRHMELIAWGSQMRVRRVANSRLWSRIQQEFDR